VGHVQAFHRLAGDLGDEVEVLILVQHGQPGEFSSRGDNQVRYRRSAMLSSVRKQRQDLYRTILDGRGQGLHGH
jgi:hypothetical protein